MAFQCCICGKKPASGYSVSHSRRHVHRRFLPNLQKVRLNFNGSVRRAAVCTSCLKAGKVKKAA